MSEAAGPFGPLPLPGGGTRFRLWAPQARGVELVVDDALHEMPAGDGGWYACDHASAGPGAVYRFRIDSDLLVPDPASSFQPQDVFGPSEVIDHRFAWQAGEWRGRPWHEAVLYELHVGTFSAEGTFAGAIAHLDHLAAAGFTAIELMPVADFAGRRNWGYDGVLLFAPDSAYGRPEDLKRLIDAAHRRGLMVLLDAVYNHFGPEGNWLPAYAADFFTDEFHTPWGASVDYRRPAVREFAIQNALHWLQNYRFDGLRLDAVHAIRATGQPPILADLHRAVAKLARQEGRHIHLVVENEENSARLLAGGYTAQWNDDYHHAWHVLLTGEAHSYYRDYQQPMPMLRRALSEGFVYQGEPSINRGDPRGEVSTGLPPTAFIDFLQNHDQIGNRPFGERLDALAAPAAIEAALATTLLAPQIPMLFMGEEWGAGQPFPFFCDFHGALAQAVREGRRREFAAHYESHGRHDEPPDALEPATFEAARLRWSDLQTAPARRRLMLVRQLLALRRRHIVPRLVGSVQASVAPGPDPLLEIAWRFGDGAVLTVQANLSADSVAANRPVGTCLWGEGERKTLPPWHVGWFLAAP